MARPLRRPRAVACPRFQKTNGSRIAAISEERDLLESGAKLDFHYSKHREFDFDAPMVDWVFGDGEAIKLGEGCPR